MVDLSMPVYIHAALHRFQHSPPKRKEHAPHRWEKTNYGGTHKLTKADDTLQKLPPECILRLQKITGTLLLYAKSIDLTILVTLGKISAAQTSGKTKTEKAMHKLIDYCATHTNSTLRYKASSMVLKSHSDASYFSESQSGIRAGSFFYMGGENDDRN